MLCLIFLVSTNDICIYIYMEKINTTGKSENPLFLGNKKIEIRETNSISLRNVKDYSVLLVTDGNFKQDQSVYDKHHG